MEAGVRQLVAQRLYAMCRLQSRAHTDTPAPVRTIAVRLILKGEILDGEADATGCMDQSSVRTQWVITRQTGRDLRQWVALRVRGIKERHRSEGGCDAGVLFCFVVRGDPPR